MALVFNNGNPLNEEVKAKLPLADVRPTYSSSSGVRTFKLGEGYVAGELWQKVPEVSYQLLNKELKKSPEVQACFRVIVEDVLSDGHYFEGGRNKKLKARKFWLNNRGTEVITAFLWDALATGDGYIYAPKLTEIEVKSYLERIVNRLPFNIKSEVVGKLLLEAKQIGDLFEPRSFIEIASQTITIDYDEHGIINKYVQKVAENVAQFSPEEIIHWRLQKKAGKVYGFSPLESILLEMKLLSNIKKSAGNYFEVGEPQRLYILEDETPDSPNYQAFKAALKKYSRLENRYRNLIATGKVTTVELNRLGKDMEFRELARYLTQLLIMVWGIPASRLSDLLVSSGLRGSTVSSEGYYRKISHLQDRLEDEVINPLFDTFGVEFKFKRTYKQDEVREVQIELFRGDAIEKQQGILSDYDLRMKKAKVLQRLGLEEDDVEKGKIKKKEPSGTKRQTQIRNPVLLSESEEKLAENLDKQRKGLGIKSKKELLEEEKLKVVDLELKSKKKQLMDELLKKVKEE